MKSSRCALNDKSSYQTSEVSKLTILPLKEVIGHNSAKYLPIKRYFNGCDFFTVCCTVDFPRSLRCQHRTEKNIDGLMRTIGNHGYPLIRHTSHVKQITLFVIVRYMVTIVIDVLERVM